MAEPSRAVSLPTGVRVVGAAAALGVGVASWHPLLTRQAGASEAATLVVIFAILAGSFGALAILRTPSWPNAPVRVALAAATMLAGMIILSMPIPPRAETWGSLITLTAVAIAALLVEALLARRPRVAAWLLLFLGVVGVAIAYVASRYAMAPPTGAAVKESFGPVALLASACVVAAWHGRSLWKAERRRAHEAVL